MDWHRKGDKPLSEPMLVHSRDPYMQHQGIMSEWYQCRVTIIATKHIGPEKTPTQSWFLLTAIEHVVRHSTELRSHLKVEQRGFSKMAACIVDSLQCDTDSIWVTLLSPVSSVWVRIPGPPSEYEVKPNVWVVGPRNPYKYWGRWHNLSKYTNSVLQ